MCWGRTAGGEQAGPRSVPVLTGCGLDVCFPMILFPIGPRFKRCFLCDLVTVYDPLGLEMILWVYWILFLESRCSGFAIYNDVCHHPLHLPSPPCCQLPQLRGTPGTQPRSSQNKALTPARRQEPQPVAWPWQDWPFKHHPLPPQSQVTCQGPRPAFLCFPPQGSLQTHHYISNRARAEGAHPLGMAGVAVGHL